jgi:hypothetical protein
LSLPWSEETPQLTAKLYFGKNGYEFSLVPTHDSRLVFSDEFTVLIRELHQRPRIPRLWACRIKIKGSRKDDPGAWGAAKGVPHYVFDANIQVGRLSFPRYKL